ncbi:fatty-acyl-CoA synthase [Sphaerisporangium siamense]|uniref:Fatty-acyl-CoA synthase n=1 Tax=Sphaerisporangium siamense TaxID=795645 RepID=A0A7W7D3A5_9ACTN|nr:AMP-binding protein [Sphaerisporangium siamense]MBB4699402.1 fatty-acyl-CoA synthase [Sphaerisporangium siamense]GII89593.1 fatty-acyl-CoA synthase [Sphaerisporangium siamense]
MKRGTVLDIAYLLRRAARMYQDVLAVDDGRTARTHAQLIRRGERLANGLDRLGVPPGAAVGILSGNRTEYVEADVALALGRRVRVALNARLHLDDFRYMTADAGLAALFYSAEFEEHAATLADELGVLPIAFDAAADGPSQGHTIESLVADAPAAARVRDTDPEGIAWISYTSGTTGRPKGVMLSHQAIREVALNLLLELGPVVPGEQIVLTQPISHGAGYFVLPYLMSGAGVHVMRQFDPEQVWRLSRNPAMRTLKAVPAMLEAILAAEPSAGRAADWGFESIVYGASGIAPALLNLAVERFGATLVQDYGQSEAPVTITCLQKRDHLDPSARLSAGRPWRSVAVEIRDGDGAPLGPGELGEVYVQGKHLMHGYHGKPAETGEVLRDGWLRTKDLAITDERGFVFLRGRRDEMINTGGFNVAPREVEDVLATFRNVEEVVVLGMPDERWGDAVTAVVRPSAGAQLDVEELLAFARPRLGIRVPRRVAVWSRIPRNAYGKVDRNAIRAALDGSGQSAESVHG